MTWDLYSKSGYKWNYLLFVLARLKEYKFGGVVL